MLSRKDMILGIIKTKKIYTQSELVGELNNAGYDVTQATISRDINELDIIKVKDTNGRRYYAEREKTAIPEHFIRVLKGGYQSSEAAGNLLVIKTVAGMAMAVAAAIDAFSFPETVGCIAGDDTIFVAVRDITSCSHLKKRIEQLL